MLQITNFFKLVKILKLSTYYICYDDSYEKLSKIFMKEDVKSKEADTKNCLDIISNIGVFYKTEAVFVKELLFLIVEE